VFALILGWWQQFIPFANLAHFHWINEISVKIYSLFLDFQGWLEGNWYLWRSSAKSVRNELQAPLWSSWWRSTMSPEDQFSEPVAEDPRSPNCRVAHARWHLPKSESWSHKLEKLPPNQQLQLPTWWEFLSPLELFNENSGGKTSGRSAWRSFPSCHLQPSPKGLHSQSTTLKIRTSLGPGWSSVMKRSGTCAETMDMSVFGRKRRKSIPMTRMWGGVQE